MQYPGVTAIPEKQDIFFQEENQGKGEAFDS